MKTLTYSLMIVGLVLVLGGILAVFTFEQPSEVFSLAWWMIVGGWGLALVGMVIDIVRLFQSAKGEPVNLFRSELNGAKGIEGETTSNG